MGVIYNIATAAELTTALGKAVAGDTLRLAGGSYGTYTIRDRAFAGDVRIESADEANPARFDGLTVRETSNLVLAGLDLGRGLNAGEPSFTTLSTIRNSTNITLSDVKVHGSLDNNPQNDGRGLLITGSRGVLVENSLFTELHRGVVIEKSFNVVLRESEWKTIRSDGVNIVSTEGLVIADNKMSDFRPISPDHGDMIQFFNTGQTKGSKNITIENNEMIMTGFEADPTTGTQGIFISDPLEFGYDNILIRNNLLYSNTAHHGITVDGARQVQILNNSVLSRTTDKKDFWIRLTDSDGIILDGNIADTFTFENATRVFQGENLNLTLFPSLRAQFANLDLPTSASDLLSADLGYRDLTSPAAAPVSGALASALSGTMSVTQSQQAFKPTPIIDDEASDVPSLGQVFQANSIPEPATPLAAVEFGMGSPAWSLRDHIAGHYFAIA